MTEILFGPRFSHGKCRGCQQVKDLYRTSAYGLKVYPLALCQTCIINHKENIK